MTETKYPQTYAEALAANPRKAFIQVAAPILEDKEAFHAAMEDTRQHLLDEETQRQEEKARRKAQRYAAWEEKTTSD